MCVVEFRVKFFLRYCCKIKVELVFGYLGNGECILRVSYLFKYINFVIYKKKC